MEGPAQRLGGAGGVTLTPSDRARARWGIDRVRLVHERADEDETDLVRALQRHLRHLPVVMFHDRRLPDGTPLPLLGIAPGGITVIVPAGDLCGPLHVERLRGMFGAYAELLRDGSATDRTALLAPVQARVSTIRGLVGDTASVEGALCLGDDHGPQALRPLVVHGLLVGGPRSVAALSAREGRLIDTEVAALIDTLHAACPPTL